MAVSIPRGFDLAAARRHLMRRDPALARWMRRIGPIERDFDARVEPVDALARAILYQQLHGKAAAAITARVEALMPRGRRITAIGLDGAGDDALRAAGVSRNKIAALRDLAAKFHDGTVPTAARLARMDDEAIVAHLTAVRGIGRWTVEMLLMSRLGRPDVFPVDDLGVRKGVQVVRELAVAPNARDTVAYGDAWSPFRTLASFYLWRIAEVAATPESAAPATRVRRSQDAA